MPQHNSTGLQGREKLSPSKHHLTRLRETRWGIILFSVWIHSLYPNAENNIVLYIVLWVNGQSSSWKPKFVLKRFTFEFKFCHYLLTLMLFQTHMTFVFKNERVFMLFYTMKVNGERCYQAPKLTESTTKAVNVSSAPCSRSSEAKMTISHHLLVLVSYQIHLISFLPWNTKGDILKNVQAVLFHSVKMMLLISTTTKIIIKVS